MSRSDAPGGGDHRLGAAVVGCGSVGKAHAAALAALDEVRLVATVDSDAGRARECARLFGAEAHATSLDDVLGRDDLDAVVVATPNATHAPLALDALRAGMHVIVQKPLATTLADADEIVTAASTSDKALMVSFFEFFHPAFRRAKELVEEGAIGEVFLLKAIMAWHADAGTWRADPELAGGGVLMEGLPHHLALFKWLLGDPQIESVYAETATVEPGASLEDTCVVLVRAKGVLAELSGSSRIREPNRQMDWFFKEAVDVYGTRGTIRLRPTERPALRLFSEDRAEDPLASGGWTAPRLDWVPYRERVKSLHFNGEDDPWVAEHRHFVNAARGREPVLTDAAFGRSVLELVVAAYDSAREGRPVAP